MQMTIGEASDKINAMCAIVRAIESGGSVEYRMDEIADFLNEYIIILSNTKVNV
jgi:hypothetical protein